MMQAALQAEFLGGIANVRSMLEALERIPGALFMMKDRASRYMYMSRALKQMIHLPPDYHIVGKTDFDLFPKVIAQSFRENDLQVLDGGKTLLNEVHVVGFFEHRARWMYSSKFPLRDAQGAVCGLITINELYEGVMGQDAELNRMLPAVDHVHQHYADPVHISELARLCGYSETQFMRVFKKHLRMTAHAFLEQVRMFHALDQIQRTHRPIAEIAVACGFYDHSAFVKRFRKFTGLTPLRYRKKEHAPKMERELTLAVPEGRPHRSKSRPKG
ncbi:MAG: HTH-type transcriptional activator Btr [Verrucomicrobiota bacterium]|jgi:AraC-like DNA-binding protein